MVAHQLLLAIFFLFCLAVIYGAICDMRSFTIPNRVSYGLVGLFLAFAPFVWFASPDIFHMGFYITPVVWNVIGGLVVFIFFTVFWKLGWVGGGDVKFVAAISLFMGLDYILPFVILMAVLSVVMVAAIKLLYIWNPYFQGANYPRFFKRLLLQAEKNAIPYGLPAAISALVFMPAVMARLT